MDALLTLWGHAKLRHINARTEGPGDSKILATDLKFSMSTTNDVLIAFHPQLRVMLFTKDGEPRFPQMGAVAWERDFRNMHMHIDPMNLDSELTFKGVKLKAWQFTPKKGGLVDLVFQAQVQPDQREFGILGRMLLTDSVRLRVVSDQGDLFAAEASAVVERAHAETTAALREADEAVSTDAAPQGGVEDNPPPASNDSQQGAATPDTAQAGPSATSQSGAEAGHGQPASEPAAAATTTAPPPAETAAPAAAIDLRPDDHDNVVPAFNPAGTPLGFRLDKRSYPVGTTCRQAGVTYDVTGQGAGKIILSARAPGEKEAPPKPAAPRRAPLELTDAILETMHAAGKAEAEKHEDDRNFELGFNTACQQANLPRDFIDEHLIDLQGKYTEGWESVPADV